MNLFGYVLTLRLVMIRLLWLMVCLEAGTRAIDPKDTRAIYGLLIWFHSTTPCILWDHDRGGFVDAHVYKLGSTPYIEVQSVSSLFSPQHPSSQHLTPTLSRVEPHYIVPSAYHESQSIRNGAAVGQVFT